MKSILKNKNHKNNNYLSPLLLIFIFLLFISLPTLKMVFSEQKEISKVEKRKLTPMPLLRFDKKSLNSFPAKFETYINDHFGFRDDLIFFRNFMVFTLLKKSPVPGVAIGKNGWLFYKTDTFGISLSDDFRGLATLTPLQLESMRIHLETKRNWLESKGIKYLYIAIPNKQSIYPEYLPDNFKKIKHATQIDQLLQYLNQNSDLHILDLRPILLEAKKNAPFLYFRTDSHWNELGAYIAYRNVMSRMQEFFPELKIIDESEIEIKMKSESGRDLATLMGLPEITEKNVPSVKLKSINTTQNIHPEWALKSWPIWTQPYETSNKKAKLRAVVFRDSFIDSMLPFFAEHFKEAAYIASKFDYSIVAYLIEKIHPDIVIEEGIERHTFLAFLPESIHATRGNDFLISGQLNKAIFEFQKALEIKPNDPDSYNNMGFALLQSRRFDEAIVYLKKAVQIDPAHSKANENLKIATNIIIDIDKEITITRKSLALQNNDPELRIRLGQLYQRRGLPEKAIYHLEKAISYQPANIKAIIELAIVYSTKKEYNKAILFFKQAIEINPERADIYYNIACLYSIQNHVKDSIHWLKAAIEKGYDNMDMIKKDNDLKNIKHHSAYKKMIGEVKG